MNPKEAISVAKQWVRDVFSEEGISDIRLEEVRFDDAQQQWLITVSFARPARNVRSPSLAPGSLSRMLEGELLQTSLKVVRIRSDGRVLAVENRETEPLDV
jgi:hypothetical protein